MPKQVNDSILTSWAETLGVRVEERRLAGDRCGIYYDPLRLVILDDRLAGFQRRCTLCHELIHAKHHDSGCGTQYGLKCERRGFVYAKSAFHAVTATNARTPNTHSHWTI